jgi:hypothetical protein
VTDSDKHSSLLRFGDNYSHESFIEIAPDGGIKVSRNCGLLAGSPCLHYRQVVALSCCDLSITKRNPDTIYKRFENDNFEVILSFRPRSFNILSTDISHTHLQTFHIHIYRHFVLRYCIFRQLRHTHLSTGISSSGISPTEI